MGLLRAVDGGFGAAVDRQRNALAMARALAGFRPAGTGGFSDLLPDGFATSPGGAPTGSPQEGAVDASGYWIDDRFSGHAACERCCVNIRCVSSGWTGDSARARSA